MDLEIKDLINSSIKSLTPYEPGKPIEDLEREYGIKNAVKLASNESPLGPSPKVSYATKKNQENIWIIIIGLRNSILWEM